MQGNRLHKSTLDARLVKKIRKLIPTGVRFDQFQVVGIRYNMGTIQAQFAGETCWHTAHDLDGYKDLDGKVIA